MIDNGGQMTGDLPQRAVLSILTCVTCFHIPVSTRSGLRITCSAQPIETTMWKCADYAAWERGENR